MHSNHGIFACGDVKLEVKVRSASPGLPPGAMGALAERSPARDASSRMPPPCAPPPARAR